MDIGHNMDDDTFLIHVMMSLPKEYHKVVRDMKKLVMSGNLTGEETTSLPSDQYSILKKENNWDASETALTIEVRATIVNNKTYTKKKYKGI